LFRQILTHQLGQPSGASVLAVLALAEQPQAAAVVAADTRLAL